MDRNRPPLVRPSQDHAPPIPSQPSSHPSVPQSRVNPPAGTSGPPPLSTNVAAQSKEPVKRKPVGSAASSPASHQPPQPPPSLPTDHQTDIYSGPNPSQQSFLLNDPSPPLLEIRNLDDYPKGTSPLSPTQSGAHQALYHTVTTHPPEPSLRVHKSRQASESKINDAAKVKRVPVNQGLQRAISLHPSGKAHPADNLDEEPPVDPAMITKTPRSPGPNKLTSFFGWKTSPTPAQLDATSPTPNSDKSHSPAPSPLSRSPQSMASSIRSVPRAIDTKKANAAANGTFFEDTGFPAPPVNGLGISGSAIVDDLQDELREVSGELAGSIRREMELEDLVDRLQFETNPGPEAGRRTSDYFSDSGSGSARYPPSDNSFNKADDLARQKRRSEQEKAQFKLGLSQKLQDERGRRKVLEAHIQQLGEQMQVIDEERAQYSDAGHRVRDLENALEDHRRRLQEEKQAKQNFEDILEAVKGEIAQYRDERDNLRDEVVPQLKARLDGLEGDATELQKLTYENTRMQQELQSLRNENTTLMNARRNQLDMQGGRFGTIAEEGAGEPGDGAGGFGLNRSNSVAKGSGLARGGSLKRSNSVSSKEREFNERVKDIELQRDALHKALKLLLDRQNYQTKEHAKQVQMLETERDRALQTQSPRRQGYEKEVSGLKFEVNALRRRADDALQQKYQCEKGLGGLKMDLDRAEEETMSLRRLLHEHDILVPERPSSAPAQDGENGPLATSASLEKAYRELQRSQAESITKLRELHGTAASEADDADISAMMEKLLKSMSDVEAERDFARKQAAMFRAEAESLKQAESYHSGENAGLVDQLGAAASRVEKLSQQVQMQLDSNRNLRQRLAEAVNRGEQEQKDSTTRINSMQDRLKNLEDKLMAAQQDSEEKMTSHEEEIRELKESHNAQLQRLKSNLRVRTSARTSAFASPRNSAHQSFSAMIGTKSPRLDKTTSGVGRSLDEALRVEFLEKRVAELEEALGEADKEMEEVISRMNMTQIEVIELQSARDDAIRQTKKLQTELVAEKKQVESMTKRRFGF